MSELGVPSKLVRITKSMMCNTKGIVRVQGELGEDFRINKGLKQGDGLAPMLFNLALEGVIRKIDVNVNGNFIYKSKQIAAYADDINYLARSPSHLKEIVEELERAAKLLGLQINENKTKIMCQNRKSKGSRQNTTIKNFEKVEIFKYLGSVLTAENDEARDVKERLNAANRAYFSLLPALRSRNVHRKTKILWYKNLIRSIIT